ncbi:MAG: CehA/McbA family metallohydrolase [Trueperaceae bacterium]|nr:CehA/McbA family metallohydrolase [Trueperaceae bacterium]
MQRLTLTGRVTPEDRARQPVLGLPFEVPAGTSAIHVAYQHEGGSLLDLGLGDPRLGPFPSERGFRGWSGGARREVFVATDDATPGYLPGPLPAGTWQVLLGLARVAQGGCAYRVEVTLHDPSDARVADARAVDTQAADARDATGATPDATPSAPRPSGPAWYAGDLQAHTHHSDAAGSLDELAAAARARILDFVAVTDHNTVSHHRAIAAYDAAREGAPLLIPGEEVTTYRGHANVWGARDWVDFRTMNEHGVARAAERARELGGLFSVNHPKPHNDCLGCEWEYDVPDAAEAFEAWQGPWPQRNWASLARYDAELAAGRRLTLVGGSDRHQPAGPDPDPPALQVGSPTTFVWAEACTTEAILAGIRRGRVFVGEGPEGPSVILRGPTADMGQVEETAPPVRLHADVRAAEGATLRWVGPDGPLRSVDIDDADFEDACTLNDPPRFVRLEVVARDPDAATRAMADTLALDPARTEALHGEMRGRPWVRALSNPLYFPGREGATP